MERCFLRMSMKVKVNILTHRIIFYIKVFIKVIEMESFSKFLRKLLKIGLACVEHLNIAGNTW